MTPTDTLLSDIAIDVIRINNQYSAPMTPADHPASVRDGYMCLTVKVDNSRTTDRYNVCFNDASVRICGSLNDKMPFFHWYLSDYLVKKFFNSIEEDWLDGECDYVDWLGPDEYHVDLDLVRFIEIYETMEKVSNL